ncbi:MAG: helix-turn-helix domain-containing protein [Candidatus Obscuribacterales bacterium]|nr:helix-turn-helix domain-containing protein [Candidatus Obscuribacterales bacterium]
MIKNELQYKKTRMIAVEVEIALSQLSGSEEFQALDAIAQRAYTASLKRQLSQLNQELSEYESLKGGDFDFGKLPEIDEIPKWLIQARIARGLAQEDLAKLLNLKKQQIQSYEASDYASASLSRIMEIARMLHSEPDSAVS